jgi:tetratricopeptide (TPR) repeat protein
MNTTTFGITIKFHPAQDHTYQVDLTGPQGQQYGGQFILPYDPPTWTTILRALEPDFTLDRADDDIRAALQPLGDLGRLPQTIGQALAEGLLADPDLLAGFNVALRQAEEARQPLPVTLHFGYDCDLLAALPWELLYHKDRFLVADTSIALTRCPASAAPPTPALADLPLRVLLVLSEPLDASPILPERAREQLVHGLRALDEQGAVIVDLLRPPAFDTLVEAVTNGGYHMLLFYGHGVYDARPGETGDGPAGGHLLFEDEFGGQALVKATELGAALRNTDVRLVLLGACQSAQLLPSSPGRETGGAGVVDGPETRPNVWRATAPALIQAGVPLAIGMQVSMRVDAAQAFIRQFALSLAAGKSVTASVADARKPLIRAAYGRQWFAPALYGSPADHGTGGRLFDAATPLPAATAGLRADLKTLRVQIADLEQTVGRAGAVHEPAEIAQLRAARRAFAGKRTELSRRTRPVGAYTQVTSPLYGVPSNPVFVGRSADLCRVAEALHGQHPVVVWGPGGIGKSALAIEVAHRQGWRFPAGVLWLDGRAAPPFDTLLNRIGAFCGLEGIEGIAPDRKETAVRQALSGLDGRCLLVWDNAETVWDNRAVRQFIRRRLPPNCQALLTTRVNPEQPMWPTVELTPLADPAMIDLFYRLAVPAGVKVGAQADLDAIPHVVDWLQGHPLALTLVVPLMAKRGIRRVWRELQQRPLQGIEAAFALSYRRLDELQQRLFARLSVFTIPFGWEAAPALLPDGTGLDQALDVLVQRALVTFDGARYHYHTLLRQYAYAELEKQGNPRPVHRLAAEYLQAKRTSDEGGTPEEALEEVDQWAQAEDWEQFARRASALVGSLDRIGYWAEIQERLERALAAVREHRDDPRQEAALLNDLGAIASKRAEWDRAIEMFKLCLETKERVGDVHGMAQTWGNLGIVYLQKGEWDRAIEMYEHSLETKERVGDVHGMAQTWGNLGYLYQAQGDTERAAHFAAHAYLVFAQLGAAPEAQQAGRQMVDILGSPDEANAYLAQLQAQEDGGTGITLLPHQLAHSPQPLVTYRSNRNCPTPKNPTAPPANPAPPPGTAPSSGYWRVPAKAESGPAAPGPGAPDVGQSHHLRQQRL